MSLTLTPAELEELTGLTLPRCQVKRLHDRGFARARLERGRAILERAHYDAVCRGEFAAPAKVERVAFPRLRAIK